MTRFWIAAALLLCGLLAPRPADAAPAPDTRPNILFCIADDASWAHFGANGERAIKTPTFDRVAREGVRFTNAFCSSPSCTPSRAAVLTGQAFSRLGEGANLWSTLPARFAVYPDLLEKAGYAVGAARKGWGPGSVSAGGRTRNPAGPSFSNFAQFLSQVPAGKPFCFWFGSQDPHRPYEKNARRPGDVDLAKIVVPAHLPDTPKVRADIADYLWEIARFDREVGELMAALEKSGQLDNTLVVVTSDNGMPFPRAKTNLYDWGTRMPLAVRWPARIKGGRVVTDFVSHTDFAPTFLLAAGLTPPREMTGRSLLALLTGNKVAGRVEAARDRVYLGRERHDSSRNLLGYPMRAVRTDDFLYIRNFAPEREPAQPTPRGADIDDGPTKRFVLDKQNEPAFRRFFDLSFAKRPGEELYDLRADPDQLVNVAARPERAAARKRLADDLDRWMRTTGDPRATNNGDLFDTFPFYGGGPKKP